MKKEWLLLTIRDVWICQSVLLILLIATSQLMATAASVCATIRASGCGLHVAMCFTRGA